VKKRYEKDKAELAAIKQELEAELGEDNSTKAVTTKAKYIKARIKKLTEQITELENEQEMVCAKLQKCYDDQGNLLEKFVTRHDNDLLDLFNLMRLEPFKSEHMLIRRNEHSTVLDFLRQARIWT